MKDPARYNIYPPPDGVSADPVLTEEPNGSWVGYTAWKKQAEKVEDFSLATRQLWDSLPEDFFMPPKMYEALAALRQLSR